MNSDGLVARVREQNFVAAFYIPLPVWVHQTVFLRSQIKPRMGQYIPGREALLGCIFEDPSEKL